MTTASVIRRPKNYRGFVFSTISYILLIAGSLIMIFPLFWMFTASLKPEWQILVKPPIWIPSKWIHAQAGNTPYEFPLWQVTDDQGEEQEVIKIGVRRFTSVIDGSALPELLFAPSDELSDAVPTSVNGVMLNVRQWKGDRVVALARAGDDLVVARADELGAWQMPLDEVNAGKRANLEVNDVRFQGRELADGQVVIPLGPESELTIVSPKDIASQAFLVPADALSNPQLAAFGSTSLPVYNLPNRPTEELFVRLSAESWQPIINLEDARAYGFTVNTDQLSDTPEIRPFNAADMPVVTVTAEDGSTQEVVILVETIENALVIPVENTQSLRLTPLGKLALPFVEYIDDTPVNYRDDYEELGKRQAIAIVGQRRDMSLVVPLDIVTEAFDVPSDELDEILVPHATLQNYTDALSRDLGGATFLTFFRNSALLVVLNLLGHFLSVTTVAYAFARLRAPGKSILFMILLSTMMLPFPVLLIPTFEIFQKFGMINTLWPLFIRSFFGNAFLIFLLRQFFLTIPQDFEDAARIDGANTAEVLWHVMLPLSKPALATIAIFTFWWTWNSFFEPFIYLSSVKNFTVSLGLGFFKGQYNTSYHLLMAASMVAILPIITLFFFAQRYFIEGIQLSGLKG
jgi:ABC-type glycerol-3-phosphate transport system permease component